MGNENALIYLSNARRAIEKAGTVQELKDIRDKAEAVRIYAKQAGATLEVQNDVAEVKLVAERRCGMLLAGMVRSGNPKLLHDGIIVKLSDLGIKAVQSHRWQLEAGVPEPAFQEYMAGCRERRKEITSKGLVDLKRKLDRNKKKEELKKIKLSGKDIVCEVGDFRKKMAELKEASVDAIITDPPYPKEYLGLFEDLAKLSKRVLRPDGSLLVMVGQSYLPDILASMVKYIPYHWLVAYMTPGGQSAQLWGRQVNTFWKPVIWFVNGEREKSSWVGDVVQSEVNANDKRFHEWGQSESGMAKLVEKFTRLGDRIMDPFLGGGTTAMACAALGRKFIGFDVDPEAVKVASGRVMQWLKDKKISSS